MAYLTKGDKVILQDINELKFDKKFINIEEDNKISINIDNVLENVILFQEMTDNEVLYLTTKNNNI